MQNTMLDSTMLDSVVSSNSQELPNASSALKLFENPLFKIRVIMRCSDPWFVAKDVATCIEHSNVTKMCELCRDKDKVTITDSKEIGVINESLITQQMFSKNTPNITLISEYGLYRIFAKCNLPKCEPFESWVFDEVLPSIRKTGSYSVAQTQVSRKDQLYLAIIHAESEAVRVDALKELEEINKQEVKALTAERDEAVRTKTQYQSNLAAQMSGRVGGLTTALNRVKLENDRLKGDRFTKEDVYIIMDTQGVSFTLKTVKDVIRDSLNKISEYLKEPFPKIPTGERIDPNGKTFEVKSYVYTRKTVQAFFEYVENNPTEWQARNRKSILNEWLNHHMTIPA